MAAKYLHIILKFLKKGKLKQVINIFALLMNDGVIKIIINIGSATNILKISI